MTPWMTRLPAAASPAQMLADEHNKRRAKTDDAHRSDSRRLPVQLAIQSDRSANHGGGRQSRHRICPFDHPPDILTDRIKINKYAGLMTMDRVPLSIAAPSG